MSEVPVSVGIPTWARGGRVLQTLERIYACNPKPAEILVYVDGASEGVAERVGSSFPQVRVLLGGGERVGPGGARHQCILASKEPIFISCDDDSSPVDADFFERASQLFATHADAAVIGAAIWHRNEVERPRNGAFVRKADFTGCGHALRTLAYRQTRGYVARPVAYAMEETDLAIQLFAKGWKIFHSGELRVFHDTELIHHETPEITAASIANVALFAFLHYPILSWPYGVLQIGNKVAD